MFEIEELERAKLNISELDGKVVRLGVVGEGKLKILFGIEEGERDGKIYILRIDDK